MSNYLRKLFFLTAFLSPQLHAADTALIQKAVQSATVPMTCGKFFIAMNTSASFSPAQHSKLQEYSDLLILQATDTAGSQLGDMDKETKQELSEALHKHGESEFRKVMDSIHAIQDPTARNQKLTQVANACMDVVRTISSKK